jgi:hypothetical protein
MSLGLSTVVVVLAGPLLAMLISVSVAMLRTLIPGTIMFLCSAAVTLWLYRGLTSTCAIDESECIGGQASIFLFGIVWLFGVAVVGWFVWHKARIAPSLR